MARDLTAFLDWCASERHKALESIDLIDRGLLELKRGAPGREWEDDTASYRKHLAEVSDRMVAILQAEGRSVE